MYYNTFLVLDAAVKTEPRVFQVSKVNRTNSKGIVVVTCAQDLANQHLLKADFDEDGNVTAWWADWKQTAVAPEEGIQSDTSLIITTTSRIITSGNSTQIRVGGQKTFTITFYEDNEVVERSAGKWSFEINGEDISDILSISYPAENKVRIKFNGNDEYIGKILTVKNITNDGITSSCDIEIIAL